LLGRQALALGVLLFSFQSDFAESSPGTVVAQGQQTPAAVQGQPVEAPAAVSTPAALPNPSLIVLEPTVKALDLAWSVRHELHDKILEFMRKKVVLPDNFEVLWRMARLSYYSGFFGMPKDASSEDKMLVFQVGTEAGERARRLDASRVEGHYWYAVTLGGWGIAKGVLNALSSAGPMRDALSEAIKIDSKYHFAGPLRVRGRLYYKLPGIISFGDNQKAAEDLKKAISLAPDIKLNHIYMAEVQSKLQSKADALKTLDYAKTLPDIVGVAEEASYRRDIAELENKFR
jgi:tetratricopeptide (TPR) repeat protein